MNTPRFNFTVRVDRSVKPNYPGWIGTVMHPELELAGPAEYNLQDGVEQWLHDNQKHGFGVGYTIYTHLLRGNVLAICLNLQDGLAIQQKGIVVFRKLFADKAVFLWGSVVRYRLGGLYIPYLHEKNNRVRMNWRSMALDIPWNSNDPALRFRKTEACTDCHRSLYHGH